MSIQIIPVGEVPQDALEKISKELEEIFSPIVKEVRIGAELEVPSKAYNAGREQYESGVMLEYVFSQVSVPEEGKVLAVTLEDLYSGDLNFVFGQAQRPGKVGIISLHRLRPEFYGEKGDRSVFLERAVKEAVHEVGHLFGSSHCEDFECVMSFSNSIVDVDRKNSSFCKDCEINP